MKYMDVSTASALWGISDRRIRYLCNEGRIDGAIKTGWSWTIPSDTPKPRDGRVLRHFKNMDIRPGGVDVDRLLSLTLMHPLSSAMKGDKRFLPILRNSLIYLLENEKVKVSEKDVNHVFSGKIVPSLSLETHLIMINFRSAMLSLFDRRSGESWSDKDMRLLYSKLMQGIDDISSMSYRDGFSLHEVRGKEKLKVDAQMETLLAQYEGWKGLNGLMRAVMLYGEIERICPFSRYPSLFSYLVLSGELISAGILPPLFMVGDEAEFEASYFIALTRGRYRDFTSFVEGKVYKSYKELMKDV